MSATKVMMLTAGLLLTAFMMPSASADESIHFDCRGGEGIGSPVPKMGLFRLACPSVTVECLETEDYSVCRAGAGAISVVGGDFCRRPIGPLPSPVNVACAGAMDAAAGIIEATGCSEPVPVGDQMWIPGVFARVRDNEEGPTVVAVSGGCGGEAGYCEIHIHDDLRPTGGCYRR